MILLWVEILKRNYQELMDQTKTQTIQVAIKVDVLSELRWFRTSLEFRS